MFTDTMKVFALAALIVAVGVAGVEGSRSTAQAGTPAAILNPVAAAAYAGARVDTIFDVVAAMPPAGDFMLPLASKGDLPVPLGCRGVSGDVQAECMDVAYEQESAPSLVVETRIGSTSTLLRMDPMTLAVVAPTELQANE